MRVSLVIPVRDEIGSLAELFESIQQQTLPPDEVVVVDGGSRDGTPDLARTLADGDPRFRIIEAGDATPGQGRNVGIEAAAHDWIALCDAGMRLDHGWLKHLVARAQEAAPVEVVYGTVDLAPAGRYVAWLGIALAPPTRMVEEGRVRGPSIGCCLVHRDTWRAAGGFLGHRSGEDLLFMRRIASAGARTVWAPDARVSWQLPADVRHTFARSRLYSYHGVLAGFAPEWHHGVARYYVLAAPFLLAGATRSRRWLAVPVAGLLARAGRECWRHRHDHDHNGAGLDPVTLLAVAAITLVIDTATFIGWAEALRAQRQAARDRPAGRSSSCAR